MCHLGGERKSSDQFIDCGDDEQSYEEMKKKQDEELDFTGKIQERKEREKKERQKKEKNASGKSFSVLFFYQLCKKITLGEKCFQMS